MSSEALNHATKLLSGRDKTTAQVRDALERKGFPRADIDAAIARCVELKYLDDARIAKRLALDGLDDGWVGDALLGRLTAKGLEDRVAHDAIALAREERGYSDRSAAVTLLTQRKLSGPKAARFLASRGFAEELVEQLVTGE
ncbi:MAG: regulatory protein RecX [Archangium sp.]